MEGPHQGDPCAICLGRMDAGGGQAIFTAECSHTFHFHCISASVAHGHLVCPLCNAQWRELPFQRPTEQPPPPTPPAPAPPRGEPVHGVQQRRVLLRHVAQPPAQPAEPGVFDDDEQLEPPAPGPDGQRQEASASGGTLVVNTHTEYSALARDASRDSFAVLVHLRAPGMADGADAPRAPLDLVTVLDVSGSMSWRKLALLKQAMGFVVDSLGPRDRLSIVAFSDGARRVTGLLRMSHAGKALAASAVGSLAARGGTNIAEGLRKAARVLGERRCRNAVSSVILLSDGQDTYTVPGRARGAGPNYEALVPPSFARAGAGDPTAAAAPVHTFGFGNDHDAAAMHAVAEATGGTFSYIENEAVVQDAFAQCIGGLLSVVAQQARVRIACGHPGVRVTSVKSGRYESRVDADGRAASVDVGELYADEERRFLLFVSVPRAEPEDGALTTLIRVACSYRDAAGGAEVVVAAEDTAVARPEHAADAQPSVEVERERVRVEAADDIAAARAAAERGAHAEAVEILEGRQRAVAQSAAARGGDPLSLALEAELGELRYRVVNRESYHRSGRALFCARISTHAQQRANSVQLQAEAPPRSSANSTAAVDGQPGGAMMAPSNSAGPNGMPDQDGGTSSYATPAMRAMLLRSRVARTASADPQPPKAGEEAGSSGPKDVVQL